MSFSYQDQGSSAVASESGIAEIEMDRVGTGISGPAEPGAEQQRSGGRLGAWVSWLLLVAMAATLGALLRFPVQRALSFESVNYNEGWNAYKQEMAAEGIPLYGTSHGHFTGNVGYPPLSFHLVGWIGEQIGSFTQAGRWLALISMLAAGLLTGLIVVRTTGSYKAGLFCFLLYEIGIVLLLPNYVGMNDPQFSAEALCALAFCFYLWNARSGLYSPKLLCFSALAFCLAGFYKHSIIAVPAAVGLDLLLRSRKSFLIWMGTMLASAGALTALTIKIDGPYFLASLLGNGKRAYSLLSGFKDIHTFLGIAQFPLLVIALWCIYSRRRNRAVILLMVLTYSLAFYFSGGDGVAKNIFFGAWMATVLACGMALAELDGSLPSLGTALSRRGVAAVAMTAVFLGVLANIPRDTFYAYKRSGAVQSDAKDFRAAVHFLKSRPGPAMCETLLLCYDAGKKYEFDPYYVEDRVRTGALPESDMLEPLRTHHFQTVQIVLSPADQDNIVSKSLAFRSVGYLTPLEMDVLLDNYQLAMRTPTMLIFIPKG